MKPYKPKIQESLRQAIISHNTDYLSSVMESDIKKLEWKDFEHLIQTCIKSDFAKGLALIRESTLDDKKINYIWSVNASVIAYPQVPISYASYFFKKKCLEYLCQFASPKQIYHSVLTALSLNAFSDEKRKNLLEKNECVGYLVKQYMKTETQNKQYPHEMNSMIYNIFKTKEIGLIESVMSIVGEKKMDEIVVGFIPDKAWQDDKVSLDNLYDLTKNYQMKSIFESLEIYLVNTKYKEQGQVNKLKNEILKDYRFQPHWPELFARQSKSDLEKTIPSGKKIKLKKI